MFDFWASGRQLFPYPVTEGLPVGFLINVLQQPKFCPASVIFDSIRIGDHCKCPGLAEILAGSQRRMLPIRTIGQ
jgi:hypothetical protein